MQVPAGDLLPFRSWLGWRTRVTLTGQLMPSQTAAPSAHCPQGKEERGRCMSIHRRVMTQPCGQGATALRVAPQRPPYGGAHLDHRLAMALRRAPCLAAAAEATRLVWLGIN